MFTLKWMRLLTMHVKIATDNWPHFCRQNEKIADCERKRRALVRVESSRHRIYVRYVMCSAVYSVHMCNFNFSRCLVINDSVIHYYFPLNDLPSSSSPSIVKYCIGNTLIINENSETDRGISVKSFRENSNKKKKKTIQITNYNYKLICAHSMR